MKIRKGFVTNSSSSNFILGFKSEDTIKDELENSFPVGYKSYLEQLLSDLFNNQMILSKEECLKEIYDYFYQYHKWEDGFEAAKRKFQGEDNTWEKIIEHLNSAECEEEIKKITESDYRYLKAVNCVNENNYFMQVEYEDHSYVGDLMEHTIMPKVGNVIFIQSCH